MYVYEYVSFTSNGPFPIEQHENLLICGVHIFTPYFLVKVFQLKIHNLNKNMKNPDVSQVFQKVSSVVFFCVVSN